MNEEKELQKTTENTIRAFDNILSSLGGKGFSIEEALMALSHAIVEIARRSGFSKENSLNAISECWDFAKEEAYRRAETIKKSQTEDWETD